METEIVIPTALRIWTGGDSLWSKQAPKEVLVSALVILVEERNLELMVVVDERSWDVKKYGLIYTDRGFLMSLREALQSIGFSDLDVLGIEYPVKGQALQGENYVSLEMTEAFRTKFIELATVEEK